MIVKFRNRCDIIGFVYFYLFLIGIWLLQIRMCVCYGIRGYTIVLIYNTASNLGIITFLNPKYIANDHCRDAGERDKGKVKFGRL